MAKFYDGPENPVCKLEGNLSSVEMRLIWYAGKDVMVPFLLPCGTAKDEYKTNKNHLIMSSNVWMAI